MQDTQLIEIKGRHRLVEALLAAGLEVSLPVRDRGVDLIVYADLSAQARRFAARPIQMKSSSAASFMVNTKYEKFPDLLIVFVWYVLEPEKTIIYALTHEETVLVADEMGYTNTDSWRGKTKTAKKQKRGAYYTSRPSLKLKRLLEPFKMSQEKWRTRVIGSLRPRGE